MIYFCCDERRRDLVKGQKGLNGIDFLEVSDNPADPYEKRQRTLFVYFINELTPDALTKENVRIEGGERIRNIKVTNVAIAEIASPPSSPPPSGEANLLVVEVAEPGDFSTYTLRLVQGPKHIDPPEGFDPILSAVDFSFKVACLSDFDCKEERICPAEPRAQPGINYLAKDYASFRQLMLDRMAVLMPQWRERNAADLGIALVELLAYVGDYLSYQQDAVATEAYLGTARRRISVRRHARLVDYFMHDGCNARAWVQVRVRPDVNNLLLKRGTGKSATKLLTRIAGQPTIIPLGSPTYEKALATQPEVFELMHDITLFAAHNDLRFHTWGERECCLPKGATRATLRDSYPNLKKGDVLIFIEVRGPQTGEPEDADPAHRHAVRLTEVTPANDPVGGKTTASPADLDSAPVTEIRWHRDDALPFPLCISSRVGTAYYGDVSLALGNIALADHGRTVEQDLDPVPSPDPRLVRVPAQRRGRCEEKQEREKERKRLQVLPRFRPPLKEGPLTQAATILKTQIANGRRKTKRLPFDPEAPASAEFNWKMGDVLPAITLDDETWLPRRDLLSSDKFAKEFVVEVETDGTACLRFGDDQCGSRPATGAAFTATYRVGNGVRGNVGEDTLGHVVTNDPPIITELGDPVIVEIRNPLPARGGIEPESIEQVRQNAPSAFHTQERAVTPKDYADVAQRCGLDLQRAAGTFRWTGSWRTVFLTVDRLRGEEVDESFEKSMRHCLERYRMAGWDLEVDRPQFVPLDIAMRVCVKAGYFRSEVKEALLEKLSNRLLPDGSRGFFHPDNMTFGQAFYLSKLYAAIEKVDGVDSAMVTRFIRLYEDDPEPGRPATKQNMDRGYISMFRLEIARVDNDPNFPECGVFNLILKGGR